MPLSLPTCFAVPDSCCTGRLLSSIHVNWSTVIEQGMQYRKNIVKRNAVYKVRIIKSQPSDIESLACKFNTLHIKSINTFSLCRLLTVNVSFADSVGSIFEAITTFVHDRLQSFIRWKKNLTSCYKDSLGGKLLYRDTFCLGYIQNVPR